MWPLEHVHGGGCRQSTVLEVGRSHLNNASVSVAQGDVGGQLPIQSRSYPAWEYKCKLI